MKGSPSRKDLRIEREFANSLETDWTCRRFMPGAQSESANGIQSESGEMYIDLLYTANQRCMIHIATFSWF